MPQPWNVVLILTDQQHFRTLGCHGVPEARTPNIDRLADGGLVFRNHFVTNPVCSPSRGSIMTGRQITEHGLWANGCALPDTVPTIPQVLGEDGYQTAHFGKLHLWPIITRNEPHPPYGFGDCEVAEGDQQLISDCYFNWLRREHPEEFVMYVNEMYAGGHVDGYTSKLPEELHLSSWVTRRTQDWLCTRRRDDAPFFLSVGYFDPHHAWNPVEPYASMFEDAELTPVAYEEGSMETRPKYYRDFAGGMKGFFSDEQRYTKTLRCYHAMCAHIDRCVGDLMETLREQGLAENTLVIYTSDHGELMGNHHMLWKGPFMLDDLLRVPMIVNVPGAPRQRGDVDGLTSSVDLMATMQALAGGEYDAERYKPLVDAELNPAPQGHRPYVVAEWEHFRDVGNRSLRCVRTDTHKVVFYGTDPEAGELYRVADDPNEFWNLYHDPAHRGERDEMLDLLTREYTTRRPFVPHHGGW